MNAMQAKVEEFHRAFAVAIAQAPAMPAEDVRQLREDLIREELGEFMDANERENVTDAADALADLLYVVLGACSAYGIDIEPIFDEVHRSNMSKLWTWQEMQHAPASATEPLTFVSAFAGVADKIRYVAKRSDGKVIKSPGYSRANIEPLIVAQIRAFALRDAQPAKAGKVEKAREQGALFDAGSTPEATKPGHAF